MLEVMAASVRREGSRHQIGVCLRGAFVSCKVMEMGWWSERYMGSIDAAVRHGKSVCERKR